jgi:hypothetical protein
MAMLKHIIKLSKAMKKQLITGLAIASIAVSLMVFSASNSFAEPPSKNFIAFMDGDQMVFPVDTEVKGWAKLTVNNDGTLDYRVISQTIPDFISVKIQFGAEGLNGPVVVELIDSAPSQVSGLVGQGTITDDDVDGLVDTVAELVEEMEAGNIYVVIRTESNPSGLIRGQF